jgi:hypothetical protein
MATANALKSEAPDTPFTLNIAMYGGPRAGKSSLLASMYRGVAGEVSAAGLELGRSKRSRGPLDDAYAALARLPDVVAADPLLQEVGVETTPMGSLREFDFIIHGAGVDIATLRFYDFSGEDLLKESQFAEQRLAEADVMLVAINTPAMMEAQANPDFRALHVDLNLPDQIVDLVATRKSTERPLQQVLFCPIKCERWLHEDKEGHILRSAVESQYRRALASLKAGFKDAAILILPVETVGGVEYDGLELYNPAMPPSADNVVFRWRRNAAAGAFQPANFRQPFLWTLLAVTKIVGYGAIASAKDAGLWKRFLGEVGKEWMSSSWTRMLTIDSVKRFFDNQVGVTEFRTATDHLVGQRSTEPPCHVIQEGAVLTRQRQ